MNERYASIRAATCALATPLSPEDQTVQSIPEVSPTKWHLAHTTWFFETFVLKSFLKSYEPFDARFDYLFNSYYETLGARHPREQRGLLTRPDVETVMAYRRHVDAAMERLMAGAGPESASQAHELIELGLNHEEQHQELILMDIKHVFSLNPLQPAYVPARDVAAGLMAPKSAWTAFPAGLREIGHAGKGFAFDNEAPRHRVWLDPFELMNRAVTVGEYLAFMEAGGYSRPEFWLSDGWATASAQGWKAPLYWSGGSKSDWTIFTLGGARKLNPAEPVCHVSYYEADAFARWAGKRLPTEAEWEVATATHEAENGSGNFASSGAFHPLPARTGNGLRQLFGDVWEWTASPYVAYPRYRPAAGAVGEYNGKFMSGQMVLRGGSAVTPAGHARATYRNFFPPGYRVVFAGIRLANDA